MEDILTVTKAKQLLKKNGIEIRKGISGESYQVFDAQNNKLIWDDPACEDSNDMGAVVTMIFNVLFPDHQYFIVRG